MCKVNIIGDVHLGRQFINGVPLHRRGERETMVWEDFERRVNIPTDLCVQTGDLFDGFIVPNEVVLKAANIYTWAAMKNPKTLYVIYRGNHDASRNESRASSFDIFEALCRGIENLIVVKDSPQELSVGGKVFGFVPWHPFKTSLEMVKELSTNYRYETIFGHWDTSPFNGDDSNTIPFEYLNKFTKRVVTGHIHLPQEFKAHGLTIEVVGSMQPYAHSEDPTGYWYQTYSIESVPQIDPSEFLNRNVRLVAKRGDEIPDLDCLSLTIKYVEEEDEVADISVEFKDFDIHKLFAECLVEQGVNETVSAQITSKFKELRK